MEELTHNRVWTPHPTPMDAKAMDEMLKAALVAMLRPGQPIKNMHASLHCDFLIDAYNMTTHQSFLCIIVILQPVNPSTLPPPLTLSTPPPPPLIPNRADCDVF